MNKNMENWKEAIIKEAEKGIDIYADYRDELSSESIQEIHDLVNERAKGEDPINIFKDYLEGKYEEWLWDYDDEYDFKYACENTGIPYDELEEDEKDELLEVYRENYFYNLPFDHYLGQKVCLNIVLDVGDANYDFGINEVFPHYDGDYDTLKRYGVPNESCIAWLAKKQGYSKKALKEALLEGNSESKFLKSIYVELRESTSALPSLTFMKSMTIEEWLTLANQKYITIDKNTRTGLVDFWNGAGGMLNIELEKDIKFDSKFVHLMKPDECFRYGVLNIYCASESLYN